MTKINQGQERSVKAKKNILFSLGLRGLSIIISVISVPITLSYINVSQYGIWITMSSLIVWLGFFDIGLTQGLRNKFAEAVAKKEDELAQIYVSTTYAILIIICSLLWVVFLTVNPFLNWSSILKLPASMNNEVSIVAFVVFSYFCLQFVLRVITTLLTANQQPAIESFVNVMGQAISLILIIILTRTTKGSLIKLSFAFCLAPVLVLVSTSIFFFRSSYKKYRPLLSKVKFQYAKGLFNLGLIFFVIQIAGIVQYETANIIIARNFSTSDVTSYNIVYKYFGILSMVFSIFVTPFWSASTEAYLKNDIKWIKGSIRKYKYLNVLLLAAGVIMLIFSQDIYTLWLGKDKVSISFYLSLWGLAYFGMTMFVSKYVFFLNGINALRIQFIACLISPVIYIGTALLLIKYYHMGTYALFIASIICNFNGIILAPLQYHMIINKNKRGIWAR
jgi:O-antigen/teichoic acid export membrane protein